MRLELKTIHLDATCDITRSIEETSERVFLLERNGIRYIVTRLNDENERTPPIHVIDDSDIWEGYDPEALRATLAEVAGAWSDIDTEELKAQLYRSRAEGSKPPLRA